VEVSIEILLALPHHFAVGTAKCPAELVLWALSYPLLDTWGPSMCCYIHFQQSLSSIPQSQLVCSHLAQSKTLVCKRVACLSTWATHIQTNNLVKAADGSSHIFFLLKSKALIATTKRFGFLKAYITVLNYFGLCLLNALQKGANLSFAYFE
jgi:hypothetical protein